MEIESRGKSYSIMKDQYAVLEREYNSAVSRTAGMGNVQQGMPSRMSADTYAGRDAGGGQAPVSSKYDYMVRSIRPSGKASQVLELVAGNGSMIKAYIKAADQSIRAGAHLNNVQIERKNSSYGEYSLISAYQLAA